MKKIVNMFLLIIGIFVFSLPTAHAYTFTRMLMVGMEGQDVLELQKILNTNPKTQIMGDGAGSPGKETTYFGEKTLNAVKKLQNLYKQDLLGPAGLTEGTGFVGTSMISFLNEKKYLKEPVGTTQYTPVSFEELEGQVMSGTGGGIPNYSDSRFYPDVSASHAGIRKIGNRGQIEIVDKDFRIGSSYNIQDVDFYLDNIKLQRGKKCLSENICTYFIPHETKPGTYTLKTNDKDFGSQEFKIVPMSVPYPEVTTDVVKIGGETVIRGTGFTNKMKVYTAFGVFQTDTANNSFILDIPATGHNQTTLKSILYVENNQGLKSDIKFVTYEK